MKLFRPLPASILTLSLFCALSSARAGQAPEFKQVDVDNQVQIGYGLAIADVDGDTKEDILLVDKNAILWYANPSWEKHVIAENLTERDHVCIAAQDLDGDGKTEIAVGAGWNPGNTIDSGSVHYLIPPSDRTSKWEPVQLPNEPTVHRMHWARDNTGRYHLVVLPLHGRDNRGGQGAGVKILAYTMPEDPKDSWNITELNGDLHMTHNFDLANWDDDSGHELLIASKEGVYVLNRHENMCQINPIASQSSHDEFIGAGEVRHGQLPNGRRYLATVEPMHGNQVVVYTPKQNGGWNRQVIDDTLRSGHAVATGDLLNQDYDQLVVGWRDRDENGRVGIKLYVPTDEAGQNWEAHLIDDNQMAAEDLKLADLNQDGKLDIIAAGRATKNLKIYLNQGSNR